MSPSWNMYRGLTPHKVMPMPGTHNAVEFDGQTCGLPRLTADDAQGEFMGFFGFSKKEPFNHPSLGTFKWSGGYWNGTWNMPSFGPTVLLLTGDKNEPNQSALAIATELPARYPSLIPTIEKELYEHYAPYKEAVESGELSAEEEPFPNITEPKDVWEHIKIEQVLIEPLSGEMTLEVAIETTWDIEHTLGARFVNWEFLELCGSI